MVSEYVSMDVLFRLVLRGNLISEISADRWTDAEEKALKYYDIITRLPCRP
jgi:hypothetical protein